MTDDQITRIYAALIRRFDELEVKLETKADKADVERIFRLIDKRLGGDEDAAMEHAALVHQVNRHDREIQQIAKHAGLKLGT